MAYIGLGHLTCSEATYLPVVSQSVRTRVERGSHHSVPLPAPACLPCVPVMMAAAERVDRGGERGVGGEVQGGEADDGGGDGGHAEGEAAGGGHQRPGPWCVLHATALHSVCLLYVTRTLLLLATLSPYSTEGTGTARAPIPPSP